MTETETAIGPTPAEEPKSYVDGMTVDLLEEYVRVHLGKGYTKLISYEEFVSSLSGLISKEKQADQTVKYFLPPGTFYFAVSDTSMSISCYYPECYRDITHKNGSDSPVTRLSSIPNIIIGHTLTKNKGNVWAVKDTRYFATDKSLGELTRKAYTAPGSDIYILPFTNVYSDGKLCYGSNVRTASVTLPEMRPLHWYYEILFTAPFNNDLGVPSLIQSGSGNYISPDAWYKTLAEVAAAKGKFPYDKIRRYNS